MFGAAQGYGASAYDSWWHRSLLGGGFGVYLFFCLSGYLLFLPFARAGFGPGRPVDLARYARNRALRILPLYYAVAVTYLAVDGAPRADWLAFLAFGENFSTRTVARVDGPMWSLVVEVLFYLLLPFLAAALARLSRRSLVAGAGWLLALGTAAGAYRWFAYLQPSHPSALVQYNLPANFYFFVPGMLLALVKVGAEGRPWPGPRLLASSWPWLAASAAGWAAVFWRYQLDLLLGPATFALVGACVLPLRAAAPLRALGWRPLAVLGTASYSLYLWHQPIVDALAGAHLGGYPGHLVAAGAAGVAVALVSYALIEAPFLRLRTRWGDTAAAPGADPPAPGQAGGRRARLGATRAGSSGIFGYTGGQGASGKPEARS